MKKKKLLLITAIPPYPQNSGGATRIKNTIQELSKYLEDMEYTHFDFNELKLILVRDGDEISEIIDKM